MTTMIEAQDAARRRGTVAALRPLQDAGLPARLAVSIAASEGVAMSTAGFDAWFDERREVLAAHIERVPLADLAGWGFAPATGNLVHHSGRFFSIEGLRVRRTGDREARWEQPIINQAEVGILGIIAREIDGVLHFLMQAKMEPGNPNNVQLSPTVQATRSNYTRAHGGSSVRYVEHFLSPSRGGVIVDVLQSEHGAWFFRKHNRNMVVEVDDDIPIGDDFCWLTLGQIYGLVQRDNFVNMDSRTVLSCLPQPSAWTGRLGAVFQVALAASRDPEAGALRSTVELLSWFVDRRLHEEIEAVRIPLEELRGWHRDHERIRRDDGEQFSVVGVQVRARHREVASWSQPLLEPHGRGVVAFVVRRYHGVLHLLVKARAEGGFRESVELGPTVQCTPVTGRLTTAPPAFLDQVRDPDPSRVRYRAVHAEEGGRFLAAESTYLVVEADESVPDDPPADFAWATVGQLSELLRHGHYLNVEARTLIACLNSLT